MCACDPIGLKAESEITFILRLLMNSGGGEPMSQANTPSQHWQARHADNARFVADYGVSLLDWLQADKGERILDLGCGDGVLTQKIAASGAPVLGLDGSADLVAAAQRLASCTVQGDGQQLAVEHEFDAVFSNAALHWMTDAQAVVRGWLSVEAGRALCGGNGRQRQYCRDSDGLAASIERSRFAGAAMLVFSRCRHLCSLVDGKRVYRSRKSCCLPGPHLCPAVWRAGWPLLPSRCCRPDWRRLCRRKCCNEAAIAAEQYLPRDEQGAVSADYVRLRFAAVKAAPGAV